MLSLCLFIWEALGFQNYADLERNNPIGLVGVSLRAPPICKKNQYISLTYSDTIWGANTFDSAIVSMSFNSPSATSITSSIKPPPILFSSSMILVQS